MPKLVALKISYEKITQGRGGDEYYTNRVKGEFKEKDGITLTDKVANFCADQDWCPRGGAEIIFSYGTEEYRTWMARDEHDYPFDILADSANSAKQLRQRWRALFKYARQVETQRQETLNTAKASAAAVPIAEAANDDAPAPVPPAPKRKRAVVAKTKKKAVKAKGRRRAA